jgi:hypothetical protein
LGGSGEMKKFIIAPILFIRMLLKFFISRERNGISALI